MNLNTTKLEELLATLKKKEEEKDKNTVLWVLAIIGAVASSSSNFVVFKFITLHHPFFLFGCTFCQ